MSVLHLGPELELPVDDVVGQCVAVLGIRGSGKSNTAGVILEELLSIRFPLTVVDIDGEYFGLREKYELLVAGGEGGDVALERATAGEIARLSLKESLPVILDVSGLLTDEREALLLDYLTSLWTVAGTLRAPYMIAIEECHEFIPQGTRTPLKEVVARIALRGRKRGLGAIIVSQRSAKVEKDVLTQAGLLFLHRVVHEADMRVYEELIPWRRVETKEAVASLGVGECILISQSTPRKVRIRERHTFHGGYTPTFVPLQSAKVLQVRERLVQSLGKESYDPPSGQEEFPWEEEFDQPPVMAPLSRGEDPGNDEDLPGPVMKKLERIVRRVERSSVLHRRMLGFLVSREPRAYSARDLAAWLDCAEAAILAEPPTPLVELGLLFQERTSRGMFYRATLRTYVEEAFAPFAQELGSSGLHQILSHLRRELGGRLAPERNVAYTP